MPEKPRCSEGQVRHVGVQFDAALQTLRGFPVLRRPSRAMGYPLQLSARYMNSKKGAFISVGTAFAIIGVALGVAALATVMCVTGGFQAQFREKVLGVNAHVLVLKATDFHEYREVM